MPSCPWELCSLLASSVAWRAEEDDSRQERLFVEWVGKLICSNCKVVWVRIKIETLSQKYLHSLSILTAFARMWRGALWEVHYLLLSVFSLFLMFSLVKILTYKKTDLSRTSFSVKILVRSDFRYESGYIIMLSVWHQSFCSVGVGEGIGQYLRGLNFHKFYGSWHLGRRTIVKGTLT